MKDADGKDIDNRKPNRRGLYAKGLCSALGNGTRCITCDICGLHVHIDQEKKR